MTASQDCIKMGLNKDVLMGRESINDIKKYYDQKHEGERWQSQQLEFEITKLIFSNQIPEKSKILELGAGSGFYSTFLASLGHQVTALELSEQLHSQAIDIKNQNNLGDQITNLLGDARDIGSVVDDNDYDVVLNMGPMYHLYDQNEKLELMNKCRLKLRKGGLLFTSFLSRVGLVSYMLCKYPNWPTSNPEDAVHLWNTGQNKAHPKDGSFRGSFVTLDEILSYHDKTELQLLSIMSQDPCLGGNDQLFNELDDSNKIGWIRFLYETISDPLVWGSGRSLLIKSTT